MELSNLKIIALQYSPIHKEPLQSMELASQMLTKYTEKDNVDLILLPELSFCGSTFLSKEDVTPFAEFQGKGSAYQWGVTQAKRLKCVVVIGYPELSEDGNIYNSMLMISESG